MQRGPCVRRNSDDRLQWSRRYSRRIIVGLVHCGVENVHASMEPPLFTADNGTRIKACISRGYTPICERDSMRPFFCSALFVPLCVTTPKVMDYQGTACLRAHPPNCAPFHLSRQQSNRMTHPDGPLSPMRSAFLGRSPLRACLPACCANRCVGWALRCLRTYDKYAYTSRIDWSKSDRWKKGGACARTTSTLTRAPRAPALASIRS